MTKIAKVLVWLGIVVLVGLLAYAVEKQFNVSGSLNPTQPKKIGILYFRQHMDTYNGMKEGMASLGYTTKTLSYEEILLTPGPTLQQDMENGVKKLIEDKVDLIWVSMEHQGIVALDVTKQLKPDLPIVFMARFHDPVAFGLAKAYKASGNNSTGIATNMPENVQKTLQFFKEMNPNTKKVGVFSDGFMVPPNYGDVYLSELKTQAPKFGMSVVEYKTTKTPETAEKNWHEVADTIKPGDIDAIFHIAVHFHDPQETSETELATRLKIPLSVPSEDFPTGGTFAFSDDYAASAHQASVMIDKIFKGTKPSDIPIEFGAKQTLWLNLKRAENAGITFPDSMLRIAEKKVTTDDAVSEDSH